MSSNKSDENVSRETKTCSRCETKKSHDEFYLVNGRPVQPCKSCKSSISSDRNKADGYAKNSLAAKKWRAKNKEYLREYYKKKRDGSKSSD